MLAFFCAYIDNLILKCIRKSRGPVIVKFFFNKKQTVGRLMLSDLKSYYKMIIINTLRQDFPRGPVVKTLPSNAGAMGSIPGLEARILHGSQPKNQNIKQKQYHKKFNKEFKNGLHTHTHIHTHTHTQSFKKVL